MENQNVHKEITTGGAALTLAAMDEYQYTCIGQHTFYFVKRLLRDPEMRKLHAKKKAELQESGYFDRLRDAPCGSAD